MKLHEMPKFKPSTRMDVDADNPPEDMQFREDSPFVRGDFCPTCGVMLPFHKTSCKHWVHPDARSGATYEAHLTHVQNLARERHKAMCMECHGILPEHSNKCSKRTCKECKCTIELGHSMTCSQHPSKKRMEPCAECQMFYGHSLTCRFNPIARRMVAMDEVLRGRERAYNPKPDKMVVMGPRKPLMSEALDRASQEEDDRPFHLRTWSRVLKTFGVQIPGCHYRRNVSNKMTLRWHRSSLPKETRELMSFWYCDCGEHRLDWNQPVITQPVWYERMRNRMLVARLADGSKVGIHFEHGTVTRVLNHEKRVLGQDNKFRKIVFPQTVTRETTHCRLYAIPDDWNPKVSKDDQTTPPTLISDGFVVRNFKDKHSPAQARRFAILKALSEAWPNAKEVAERGLQMSGEQVAINRNNRRKVWDVYRGRGKN